MADQDFNIRVVTTADVAGIKRTSDELDKLRTHALSGRGFGTSGQLTPVPPELLDETAASGEKAAGALEKTADASLLAGANLTRARQEAIVLARELETGGNVTRTLGSLLGSLGLSITFAALGGIAVAEAFKSAAEQAEKIHKAIADQVTELDKAATSWERNARSATTIEDVSRIAAETLPILNQIALKNREIQAEQTSATQKFIELFAVGLNPLAGITGNIWRPFTDGLKAAQDEQSKLQESAQATAAAEVGAAQRSEAAWDVTRVEDFGQAVTEVSEKIKSFRDYQASIDLRPGPGFEARMTDYKVTGERVADLYKQLQGISEIEKEREAEHKLLFPSLDEETYKIGRLKDQLARLGVQTDDLGKAFAQGLDVSGPVGNKIRQLVLELESAQNAYATRLKSDLLKGDVAAQNEGAKRQEEHAAERASRRELAAEGIGTEMSAGEERKFQLEEELRRLQNRQATQGYYRNAQKEAEDRAKFYESQGISGVEDRAKRIKDIQHELAPEPPSTPPQQQQPVARSEAQTFAIAAKEIVTWVQRLYQLWQ
jgi:hypothetical protein